MREQDVELLQKEVGPATQNALHNTAAVTASADLESTHTRYNKHSDTGNNNVMTCVIEKHTTGLPLDTPTLIAAQAG
jgi:hypothetical protein